MRCKLLVIGFVLLACATNAQSVLSPYTINGIGEVSPMSVAQNSAKGDIGISYSDVWHINIQNPALLVGNTLTSFQMGIVADMRNISNDLGSERAVSGSLRYLALAFPVMQGKWTTSVGILPYSSVNYNIIQDEVVNDASAVATFNYSGEGGLAQAYWANGFKLFKGMSVGFRASYIFGAIENDIAVSLSNEDTYRSAYVEQTTYGDFNLSGGLHYRLSLKEQRYLNFGLTHNLSANLVGDRLAVLERRDFGNRVTPIDTVINELQTNFALPITYGFGITLEKFNKYAFSIEANLQQWSGNAGFENDATEFADAIRLAIGGQLTPDATDVNNYFKRVTYRAGFSYEQSPYLVSGQQINDFGINFGWSLPVSRASTLDMAFKIGQKGTLDQNLIRERYFKFILGATVNDRWFVRRKYD